MIDIAREQSYPTAYATSPLLPLLLVSLATQRHAPITKKEFKDEYDYIIVGAGTAGSIVASRLSEVKCVDVLLLEAGDDPPLLTEVPASIRSFIGTDIDWGYVTEPQKHTMAGHTKRRSLFPAGRVVGGTSVLTGHLSARGNRVIYDDWAAQGAVGWSYKEMLPYFIRMEDNTNPEFVASGYHGVDGPITMSDRRWYTILFDAIRKATLDLGYVETDSDGTLQTGFTLQQASIRDGQTCSTAKGYLVPSEKRPNLDIVKNSMVTKVLIKKRRAVGVQFDDEKGYRRTVRARKEVIVSAGGINSAKLLMLSGIGPLEELLKHSIAPIADLPVGHNFHDHVNAILFYDVSSVLDRSYPVAAGSPDYIETYIRNRTGPVALPEGCQTTMYLNKQQDPYDLPDYVLYGVYPFLDFFQQHALWDPELSEQLFGPYRDSPVISCFSQVLNPKSRGTVRLQSANPYHPPLIDPNYFGHFEDVENVVAGLKNCRQIFESVYMKKLGVEPFRTVYRGCENFTSNENLYYRCIVRTAVFPFYHPAGTVKMGSPSDPTTVLDPELRVKTIKGLRVIDASIMPKTAGSNTLETVFAIGEKGADLIKKTISCSSPPWF